MQMPLETTPRQPRRWSIWKTLAWSAVAFVLLGLAWVGRLEWRLHERRALLADIQERGGGFVWTYPQPKKRYFLQSPGPPRPGPFAWMAHFQPDPPEGPEPLDDAWGPNWLRRSVPLAALGRRWGDLDEINEIWVSENSDMTPFGDDEAARLKTCPHLKSLSLSGTQVGNQGLQTIGTLCDLETLNLERASVSSTSLSSLSRLTALESLSLHGTTIDDAGLAHLRPLKRLRELNLAETNITDAGLEVMADLPALRHLTLYRTQVTDAGVARLRTHPSLFKVSLDGTAVSEVMRQQLAEHFAGRQPSP